MTMAKESLHQWHRRLKTKAAEWNLAFLISDTPGDHADAFNDGLSVEDELNEQLEAAKDSQ